MHFGGELIATIYLTINTFGCFQVMMVKGFEKMTIPPLLFISFRDSHHGKRVEIAFIGAHLFHFLFESDGYGFLKRSRTSIDRVLMDSLQTCHQIGGTETPT